MLADVIAALQNQAPAASSGGLRWVDGMGLAILGLFLVLGILRGLWWQVVRLLGIVASVSVARALAPRLAPVLSDALPGLSGGLASGIAWLLLIVAGLLVVSMVGRLGRATIEAAQLGTVDRIGGALAGLASGLLLHVAILLCLCQVASTAWAASAVRGTRSEALLGVVEARFPMLLDARAAESIRRMHDAPATPR